MDYREAVEGSVGRKLKPEEIVHHKDGDKHNNDVSNLEIMSRKEHAKKHGEMVIDWDGMIQRIVDDEVNLSTKRLNEHLDLFFTEPQKYIILRRASGLPLTKTEREVYSRILKKRIRALANPTLHKTAELLLLEE